MCAGSEEQQEAPRLVTSSGRVTSSQKGLNTEVLKDLPGNLQAKILLQTQTGIVKRAQTFKDCNSDFIKQGSQARHVSRPRHSRATGRGGLVAPSP